MDNTWFEIAPIKTIYLHVDPKLEFGHAIPKCASGASASMLPIILDVGVAQSFH